MVGCSGLGGYLVELLARAGVGTLRVVDGDVFERSNLGRQLLCEEALIGHGKAEAARARVAAIDQRVRVEVRSKYLTAANATSIVSGCDVVLDGLDSVPTRLLLAEACARVGTTLVHAAVSGWRAQVTVVPPGSDVLSRIYPPHSDADVGGTLSFMPAFAAAVQAAEAIKLLAGRESNLSERLLAVDLLTQRWQTVAL